MKKALALTLVLVLFAGLGSGSLACSRDEVPTTPASGAPTTTTTVSETTPTSTSTSTTVATTTIRVPPQEPISLQFATTFLETEAGGKIVQRFCDYVEEKTAGAVTFDVYFAGSLGTGSEELGMVGAGSVDMIVLRTDLVPDQVPLLSIPMRAPADDRAVIGYFDHLVYDDPDTALLIQGEAAVNNVTYLACTSRGSGVFVATEPFARLADLAGRQFGAGSTSAAFAALGYTVVESPPVDTYENLSGGVIAATYGDLAFSLQQRWYEVAKHFMFDGTCAVGDPFAVNLDTWAKLTPETQAVFRDAAKEMADLSLKLEAAERAQAVKTLEAAGVAVGTLTPEDQSLWVRALFEAQASECVKRAERLGIVDDMKVVLARAAEYIGVDWP